MTAVKAIQVEKVFEDKHIYNWSVSPKVFLGAKERALQFFLSSVLINLILKVQEKRGQFDISLLLPYQTHIMFFPIRLS